MDCRLSYERLGSAINLTRNSIKTRIKKMVSEGVIQEFIADVNFAVLDYRICYVFTKQEERTSTNAKNNNSSNRKRKIVID